MTYQKKNDSQLKPKEKINKNKELQLLTSIYPLQNKKGF